jgi:predicted ABC-type ATPase
VPNAIIIAGPNGAGKTTFADEYLSAEDRKFEFVNADEIARGFDEQGAPFHSDVLAARLMLHRVDELVRGDMNFAVETTLATLTYAQKIPAWRKLGYVVSIAYLRLRSVEEALARVRKRVEAGGHGIPEPTVRRRFGKSEAYFETVYKLLVDEWYVWESREGAFSLIEASDQRQ